MASRVRGAYEQWVKDNAVWLTPLEGAARGLTIFIPGRFSSTELQSEAIYTALNLVSLYHDQILDRDRILNCEIKVDGEAGDSSLVAACRNTLSLAGYTQVLTEIVAGHLFPNGQCVRVGGADWNGKWSMILLVELLKAACRLGLLYSNCFRMLVQQSPDEAATALYTRRMRCLEKELLASSQGQGGQGADRPTDKFADLLAMYRLHDRAPGSNPHGRFSAFTNPHYLVADPAELQSNRRLPSLLQALAEVLQILRPVVYVLSRLTWVAEPWRPFFLSLLVDVSSRVCAGPSSSWSTAQRREMSRRLALWCLYAARDPFFGQYTKPALQRLFAALARLPFVGSLFTTVFKLLVSLQTYYFYTAAS